MAEDKASKIRILLADDHQVLRSGLKALLSLEEDFDVIKDVSTGKEAVEAAARLKPDVIVMDIAMPEMDGMRAVEEIRNLGLDCRVVFLTVHADDDYLFQTLKLGGSGYVLKSSADRELIQAIRMAHRGEVFLYPTAVKKLLGEYLKTSTQSRPGKGNLTQREREVLKYTAEGFTNNEIAGKLIISPKTVDTYRQRIMEKLDLHHRSELVQYALQKGLLVARSE
jgi:two-component system response regulator NreC